MIAVEERIAMEKAHKRVRDRSDTRYETNRIEVATEVLCTIPTTAYLKREPSCIKYESHQKRQEHHHRRIIRNRPRRQAPTIFQAKFGDECSTGSSTESTTAESNQVRESNLEIKSRQHFKAQGMKSIAEGTAAIEASTFVEETEDQYQDAVVRLQI